MGGRSEYPTVKKQPERPVLITDAARSQDEQFHSRQIRYGVMMGLRVFCLIVGAILASVRPPLLGLWLILCAIGVVVLPWMAVLIANDRPARSKAERAADAAARQKAQPSLAQHSVEEVEYLTIDSEVVEGDRWVAPERDRER
ncbi:DUF3099 domain-containing protein [Actinoplanes sp. CA-030573]|uniref:DUF3099 domain-containing protein n=1 Tax=Actinoplanes sp. CA-030573 TaxID=3239898 RepID=UPI003D950326